eukprot:6439243-Pyramimonas_sp.AAC.1
MSMLWFLVGALGYAMITQLHMLVYVVSLQRQQRDASIIHLRRANALVRHMQRYPRTLRYRAMQCSRQLQAFSDSGFRKEEDKGYGMRGANFLRVGVDPSGAQVCHLIDAQCRSHRRVTRNTFSSELFAGCDAVDDLMSHALALHEIIQGPQSKQHTLTMFENGRQIFDTILVIDAMSVFQAASAIAIKEPAEKGLLPHLQYLREKLDMKQLGVL